MVVTTHQPIFLPWPGFCYKALQADALVLLDHVRFPQGRGWLHHNRLKSDRGDHWLRVPIRKTGRGTQLVADVEICDDTDWRTRHLRSVQEWYAHAPYLQPQLLGGRGIEVVLAKFRPPVYPQLQGDCRYNVFTLDLVLNCGPKARDVIVARTP